MSGCPFVPPVSVAGVDIWETIGPVERAVQAGSNTLQVKLQRSSATNGIIEQYYGQITAIFSPFGETHS